MAEYWGEDSQSVFGPSADYDAVVTKWHEAIMEDVEASQTVKAMECEDMGRSADYSFIDIPTEKKKKK